MKIPDRTTAGLIDSFYFSILAYPLTNVSSDAANMRNARCTYVHVYIKDTFYVHTLPRIGKILGEAFRFRGLI